MTIYYGQRYCAADTTAMDDGLKIEDTQFGGWWVAKVVVVNLLPEILLWWNIFYGSIPI